MKTLTDHISQLKNDVAAKADMPVVVKRVCLDVLYKAADEGTLKLAQTCTGDEWKAYDVLRIIGGSSPKFVNSLFWESLPLIEEAVYGHFISGPEDFDRWRQPVSVSTAG